MFLGDLVDRAAHIDVDDDGAVIDRPKPGFCQRVLTIAIHLHAKRRVRVARGCQFHCLGRPPKDAVHIEQIRARKTNSAKFPAQEPKRQITMSRHGGKQGIGVKLDRADRQHAIIVRALADIPKNPWLKSSMQVPCAAAWL